MSGTLREIRHLRQAALIADDAALGRLVRMLDRLPERGEADGVLDPVRPRLRTLGLDRPLGLPRLLFLPLDGVIIPASRWSRGAVAVPRSALLALAGAVQALPQGAAIAEACIGHSTADAEIVARLGGRLWPMAAQALPAAAPPAWERTGLAATDYAVIAGLCRPVWQAGTAIWAAMAAAEEGPPQALAQAALRAVAPAGAGPLSATLATLLQRAAAPGTVARIAAGLDPSARPVALQALEAMLDQPPPAFATLGPAAAAALALAAARRFEDLEGCALLAGERQRKVAAARRAADEACRAAFGTAMQRELLAPAARLAAAPMVADEEVAAMEEGARQLRALESAGRRLGGAPDYDRALRDLAAGLAALGTGGDRPGGLQAVDLARSVEILAGPEAAEAMLRGAAGG